MASTFHALCDNQGPTLTLITDTKGLVFGGFTHESWEHKGYRADKEAFVFTLAKKYPCTDSGYYAIHSHSGYGPTFGGHTLRIADNSDKNTGSYRSSAPDVKYAVDRDWATELVIGSGGGRAPGKQVFTSREIEVYAIKLL